jgi:hypothetical protein
MMPKYRDTFFIVSAMGGAVLFVVLASGCTDLKPVQAQPDDLKAQPAQILPKIARANSQAKAATGSAHSAAIAVQQA